MSQREAAKHFNISRDSVRKMMAYAEPPGYRRHAPVRRPKLETFIPIIDAWLEGDRSVHRKQRHTAKRVFDRLREEHGFTGGYTIIKDYMRERDQLDLPHSDACFVRAYPAAVSEAWVDGHIQAFAFFGAVPQSVLYDNDRCLVAKILPDGTRKRAALFSGFLSHDVIRDRYGRPGKGNDKGNVEGLVGYSRRNFMVPIPNFPSWETFNTWLEGQCRKRQDDKLRGPAETIGQRLQRDTAAMRPLPASPFEACDQASGRVSSQSLVRYKTNDYSVPVAWGHQDVWIRGYVDEVVIGCRSEVIARHPRSYEREEVIFNPLHYLPLIENKINALDQAAPLQGWDLPEEFATLRRLMEVRMNKQGRREYVQVLRLLELFNLPDLHAAVKQALQMGAIGFDAVKHLVLCRVERRPPRLDLDVYPYLPKARVEKTSAAAYMCLISEDTA